MEPEPKHYASTLCTNLDNEWECLRWQIQTERENPLSHLSSVPNSTGRCTDRIEREVTDFGLHHMSGATPGWPESPPLLYPSGEEDQFEGPNETGPGGLPRELSSMQEPGSCEELRQKGWCIHLQSEHGQPQRGELLATSTCTGKRRADHRIVINPREKQAKQPRLMPPWGPDHAEPQNIEPPKNDNQVPSRYVQLEHSMGSDEDSDPERANEYWKDEYFEGTLTDWYLRYSLRPTSGI